MTSPSDRLHAMDSVRLQGELYPVGRGADLLVQHSDNAEYVGESLFIDAPGIAHYLALYLTQGGLRQYVRRISLVGTVCQRSHTVGNYIVHDPHDIVIIDDDGITLATVYYPGRVVALRDYIQSFFDTHSIQVAANLLAPYLDEIANDYCTSPGELRLLIDEMSSSL